MDNEKVLPKDAGQQGSDAGQQASPGPQKKDISKAYSKHVKKYTPSPPYVSNCVKAFIVGGAICAASLALQNWFIDTGMKQETAATYVTVILVMLAQLLTGLGVFDSIAKVCGAGVIVPITGFANSMVAPAIEYKKEGLVLGVGAKLFSLAGPVLVCGIGLATVVGVIYWVLGQLGVAI